jgi:hypothetical protein
MAGGVQQVDRSKAHDLRAQARDLRAQAQVGCAKAQDLVAKARDPRARNRWRFRDTGSGCQGTWSWCQEQVVRSKARDLGAKARDLRAQAQVGCDEAQDLVAKAQIVWAKVVVTRSLEFPCRKQTLPVASSLATRGLILTRPARLLYLFEDAGIDG